MTSRPAAVYRAYGRDGTLLYIGRSVDPARRFRTHAWEKRWWPADVAFVAVKWYADEATAKRVEVDAIVREQPPRNSMHTPRHGAHVSAAKRFIDWSHDDAT